MSMKHLQLTDELQEKACIYAAGAMPENERRDYVRHLEEDDCAVCRKEVQEMQSAAAHLALDLQSVSPSPAAKARLMAQAESVARITRPDRGTSRQRNWLTWAGWLTATAALVLLAVVARSNSELRRLTDSLNVRVAELESELDGQRLLLTSLTSRDVRVVDLAGAGAASQSWARIFANPARGRSTVYVNSLPPAATGRVYQLWWVPTGGGAPISAGVFNTMQDGSAVVEATAPNNLNMLMAAAITDEPAPGVPAPTNLPPILIGSLE